MRMTAIVVAILLSGVSACQSIPAERKNNCACGWEALSTLPEGYLT